MNWLLLAGLAGLASNGFNITNRTALQKDGDHSAYGWWFECVRTAFFLCVIIVKGESFIPSQGVISLLLVGVTELFSVYVYMKMHALTQLSLSTVISRMRVVWSPILAWLLIGEQLSVLAYIGITTIFLGIAYISLPSEMKRDRGIKTALLFSISSALLSTVQKSASSVGSTELVLVWQGIIPLVFLPMLMKNSVERIVRSAKQKYQQILLGGSFNIVSSYLLLEAIHITDASKAVGVYQAMTVVSVLYGIFVLGERDKIGKKLIGTVIVIIGVLLTLK